MPINYAVAADVVDIRMDVPQPGDAFLVDTNVWYWMAYSRAGAGGNPPKAYQVTAYPTFVLQAIVAHAELRRCELSLSELAHLVEKTELAIYRAASGFSGNPKEYRHNEVAERTSVVSEIEAAWSVVRTIGKPLPFTVDEGAGISTLGRCRNCQVDPYDAMMVEGAGQCGITQVITDDGDYCTIPGITVFTANNTVISSAKAAGKFIVR